jgi:L-tyrosine isonitrile desaturase/decarboxylase
MKYLNPFGVLINRLPTLSELYSLTLTHGIVILRYHDIYTKKQFLEFAQSIGKILEWEFGEINELKIDKDAKNYLYSNEKVPFHWDGAFKLVPTLLLFHCIKAPEKKSGGETLFTNTTRIINELSEKKYNEYQKIQLSYETDKLAHYGGKISGALISKHLKNDKEVLRYAEPVQTRLNPVSLAVKDMTKSEQCNFEHEMSSLIYDKRYCYQHVWKDNDIVLADNHALIHARNQINHASPRHLRRIQIL